MEATASVSNVVAPNMAKSVTTSNGALPAGRFRSRVANPSGITGTRYCVIAPTPNTSRHDHAASTAVAFAGVPNRGCSSRSFRGASPSWPIANSSRGPTSRFPLSAPNTDVITIAEAISAPTGPSSRKQNSVATVVSFSSLIWSRGMTV